MLMAIDMAAKGLLVLVAAVGTVALLRRHSAATRYLVWSVAMICLLLLPLLGWLLPVLHAPVLPEMPLAWVRPERAEPVTLALPPIEAAASPTEGAPIVARSMPFVGMMARPTPRAPMVVPYSEPPGANPYAVAPRSAPQRSLAPVSEAEGRASSSLQRSTPTAWVAVPTWPALLAGLYFLGAAMMLVHLAAGAARVARMIRNARPVVDGSLRRNFKQAVAKLGIERPVRLLESDAAPVPVAWELFRPAVLLPRERRQVVLLHELAHVQWRDCQMQLLAHVALAFHWLNPLAWLAMRRLRIEREHACDDKVLSFGCRPSDYADHLLQIARRLVPRRGLAWAAPAMASASRLEGRVAAILDPENPRRLPERRTTMAVLVTTLILLLPLAALQPGAQAQSVDRHTSAEHFVTPFVSTPHLPEHEASAHVPEHERSGHVCSATT